MIPSSKQQEKDSEKPFLNSNINTNDLNKNEENNIQTVNEQHNPKPPSEEKTDTDNEFYLSEENIDPEQIKYNPLINKSILKINSDYDKNIERENEELYGQKKKSSPFSSDDNLIDLSNSSFPIANDSQAFGKSFDRIQLNKQLQIAKSNEKEDNDNIYPNIRVFLFIMEIIFNGGSVILSIITLAILIGDSFDGLKKIVLFVELLIILVSLCTAFPHKTNNYKKIVVLLYIWEGILLIPLSYLECADFLNGYLFLIRIGVFVGQNLIFISSLVLKVNI